jgi:hypothetical protein
MPITEDASIQKRCLLMEIQANWEEIITDVAKVSHKWSYCAILTDRAHPSAEIENYLLSTSKLSTLYYADWITKRALFTAMITQRLTEQR